MAKKKKVAPTAGTVFCSVQSEMFEKSYEYAIEEKSSQKVECLGIISTMRSDESYLGVLRDRLQDRSPEIAQHILAHPELETTMAARICQCPEAEVREILSEMERDLGYLGRGRSGLVTYWVLHPDSHRDLSAPGHPERDRRIDREAAKMRVLSVLMERARRGAPGLTNQEIRHFTHFDRHQVVRLMYGLRHENPLILAPGRRRYARYEYGSK